VVGGGVERELDGNTLGVKKLKKPPPPNPKEKKFRLFIYVEPSHWL